MDTYKKFKLSALTAACLLAASTSFAGQITGVEIGSIYTSQDGPVVFGNGGLKLDNVDVKIVNIDSGEETGTFYPDTETYTPMQVGDAFKSFIYGDVTKENLTGLMLGKDWPVGEPHGIKAANSTGPMDLQKGNNKPASCLLSTSFYVNADDPSNYDEEGTYIGEEPADEGWLNTVDETTVNPTYCDSPFQTHKRFKVGSLTPTADDAEDAIAQPIDLVFNVEAGETAIREYMVLQKLNNYSDRRYGGVQVEVGFGVGENFVNAASVDGVADNLKISYTAGPADDYVFAEDERATFAAGLFGTADKNHPDDGFFDTRKAGFDMTVDTTGTKIYSTGIMPSNYTAIYGDWLPERLKPQGLFFDDDGDPLTDASLIAYEGPSPTDSTIAWRNGNAEVTLNIDTDGDELTEEYVIGSFAEIPEAVITYYTDLAASEEGDGLLYEIAGIEDLLNLGLTYVVEVGDVTKFPAENFTIRMKALTVDEVGSETDDDSSLVTPSSSGGGSASEFSITSLILALLALAGLGGWLASRKSQN